MHKLSFVPLLKQMSHRMGESGREREGEGGRGRERERERCKEQEGKKV
jgi:hypothetical protein